jgi:hypothetical protein
MKEPTIFTFVALVEGDYMVTFVKSACSICIMFPDLPTPAHVASQRSPLFSYFVGPAQEAKVSPSLCPLLTREKS